MQSNRDKILNWADAGHISKENLDQALTKGNAQPSLEQWTKFITLSLSWLAAICFCASVIFFFAYNWQNIPRIYKFALVEVVMLLAAYSYLKFAVNNVSKTVLLTTMCLLTGALLALVGQTYQTGADPWQLFAYWALFILPWVGIARSSVLWIFWIVLINLAITLYLNISRGVFDLFYSNSSSIGILLSLNFVLLIIFELFSFYQSKAVIRLNIVPSNNRYIQQFLAFTIGYCASQLAVISLFDRNPAVYFEVIYLCWLFTSITVYRYLIKDLFILAMTTLSFIIVSTFYLSDFLFDDFEIVFLLLVGLYIVGLSSWCFSLLKKTANQFENLQSAPSAASLPVEKESN